MTAQDPQNPELGIRQELFEIHQSDMSRVFYAEGLSGELVVVKSLDPDADDFLKSRFSAEAKILGALDHPQIPELIEDGSSSPVPHITMKPVARTRGFPRDLAYLRDHPDPEFAASAVSLILNPIGYVHGQGFIHRDIKPSNFILGLENIVLADFGAAEPRPYGNRIEAGEIAQGSPAHLQARDHMLAYGVSRIGTSQRVIGTLHYLSPEEVSDDHPDITSDIYSAGTSLYELLYGRHAHSGYMDPETAERPKTIPEGRAEEEIDFSIPDGRPIPMALIEVIKRATQKDPKDRYQTAREMQEDLARAIVEAGIA